MNEEWYYKSQGQEHGPVTLESLRELAGNHQLSPRAEIRAGEDGEWVEAQNMPSLFGAALTDSETDPLDEFTDLEEFRIEDDSPARMAREASASHVARSVADSNRVEPENALEFSSLDELGIQVSDGPSEQRNRETEAEFASLDDLDIQVSDAPSSAGNRGPVDSYGALVTSAETPGDPKEQWVCRVLGVELGPMDLADLRLLAKNGEISLDDEVRRADEDSWRIAKSVEGLFPGFTFDSGEIPISPVNEAESPAAAMPELGDDLDQALAGLESAEIAVPNPPAKAAPPEARQPATSQKSPPKKRKPQVAEPKQEKNMEEWLEEAVPTSRQEPEPTPASEAQPDPEPPPEEEPKADRAAELRAQFESRTAQKAAFTPPKPAKVKKSKPQSSGPMFEGAIQALKDNPKVLGVFAVLGLVVLIKYVPWSFGPSDQSYLDRIVAITNTLKQLRANDGPAGNLDQFRNNTLPEVKTLMTELKKQAGSRDRPKQEMLWACMMLEKVLAESPGAETPSKEEKTLDTHIANARALINGQPLPVQPEGDP